MARKNKGIFGAMGNLIRWTIWGLAGVLAVAVYLNFTKTPQSPDRDAITLLPPAESATDVGSEEEVAVDEAKPEDTSASDAEEAEQPVEDAAGEAAPAADEQDMAGSDAIRIPGDDATYSLLSAFRRDDGAIEITTEMLSGDERTTTIRLVRCAPLEVGVVATGDGPRNDAPEMVRIPLGDAAATLAAVACGAMK